MKARYKEVIEKQKEMKELKPYYLIWKWMKENLTKRQQGIVEFLILHLEGNHQPTVKEIATWFKVSTSTIYRDLKVLREKQILIKNTDGGEDLTFEKVLPSTRGVI